MFSVLLIVSVFGGFDCPDCIPGVVMGGADVVNFVAGDPSARPTVAPPVKIAFFNGKGTFSSGNLTHEREFYTAIREAREQLASRHNVQSSMVNVTGENVTEALKSREYSLIIFPGGSGTGWDYRTTLLPRRLLDARTLMRAGGDTLASLSSAPPSVSSLGLVARRLATFIYADVRDSDLMTS